MLNAPGSLMAKIDLPQGTLDLLVLRVLSAGELHGWGIAQRLSIVSERRAAIAGRHALPSALSHGGQGWIDSAMTILIAERP